MIMQIEEEENRKLGVGDIVIENNNIYGKKDLEKLFLYAQEERMTGSSNWLN